MGDDERAHVDHGAAGVGIGAGKNHGAAGVLGHAPRAGKIGADRAVVELKGGGENCPAGDAAAAIEGQGAARREESAGIYVERAARHAGIGRYREHGSWADDHLPPNWTASAFADWSVFTLTTLPEPLTVALYALLGYVEPAPKCPPSKCPIGLRPKSTWRADGDRDRRRAGADIGVARLVGETVRPK